MLPPAERLQGAQLHRYVGDKLYWSLHAPRQTGKTTFLQCWTKELNATSNFAACYVSVERCQGMSEQSQGQPWIVNNLFKRATLQILDADNYETVTLEHIQQAREQMILGRETHLESLSYRLDNPKVRYVIDKLLTGEYAAGLLNSDACRLCLDLGLVSIKDGELSVANPIYREVLAREISYNDQVMMPKSNIFRWQNPDGTLDMDALLKEFQGFWQENSEMWEEKSDYTETFPHLLVMAFLQRVTNGEGHIDREYAAGRRRMDVAIEFGGSWNIIEIKLLRDRQTFEKVKAEGLKQITNYRDTFSSSLRLKDDKKIPCYLLIFDRRSEDKKLPWEERITWNVEGEVTVAGC